MRLKLVSCRYIVSWLIVFKIVPSKCFHDSIMLFVSYIRIYIKMCHDACMTKFVWPPIHS